MSYMADFQHFLVLVDGSPASLKACEKAVYLTETCKSQVTLLYLDYCTNHPRIDCIIMGNRGFGKLKQMLLGSVSQNIIVHAPLPVMTVKETEWEMKA